MDAVTSGRGRATILVVDDDSAIRELCRHILQSEGYHILEAANGRQGLEQAQVDGVDVILMDVNMPLMDGLAATRKLREDPLTRAIPIIMVSSRDIPEETVAGLEAGADEYIPKPVNPRELVLRVRSMVRLRDSWIELQRSHELLGEQSRALTQVLDFSSRLVLCDTVDQVLTQALETAATLAACRRIAFLLPDLRRQTLSVAKSIGLSMERMELLTLTISRSRIGEVFTSAKPLIVQKADVSFGPGDRLFLSGSPCLAMPMCASESVVGVLTMAQRYDRRAFCDVDLEYLKLVCNYAAAAVQSSLTREARDEARDSIVVALAKLAERRDGDTGRHLDRMTTACLLLAEKLRESQKYADVVNDEFLKDLQRAAPLHDIGKVAIPDHILLKSGRLTPEEMTVMRTHALVGTETIRSVLARSPSSSFLQMAEEIAFGHHEWYDGNGYPQGASGAGIPLSARIAALADVYDALTSKRVYKEAMPHWQARDIILSLSGKQFDPDVVAAFLECEARIQELGKGQSEETGCENGPSAFPDKVQDLPRTRNQVRTVLTPL